jgi:hypothetical protein
MSDHTSHTQDQAAATDRDARGRFAAGNPFARRVAALRSALVESVTNEDIAAITRTLIDMARDGDVPAAKLLLAYAIGKPGDTVQPDRLDLDEWQIFRDTAPMAEEMTSLSFAPSSELPRNFVRLSRPLMAANLHKEIMDLVRQPLPPAEPKVAPAPSPNGHNAPPSAPAPTSSFIDINVAAPSPNGVHKQPRA